MPAQACQLYLISPLDVGGEFPGRLERALGAGPVAAFQFRVKDFDQHEAARLAEPLQATCARHDVAFIVNDSIALARRLRADGVHLGLSTGEREVLTSLTEQLQQVLAGDLSADPVATRMFPDAYPDDDAASAEFRRWTQTDLLTQKTSNAAVVPVTRCRRRMRTVKSPVGVTSSWSRNRQVSAARAARAPRPADGPVGNSGSARARRHPESS